MNKWIYLCLIGTAVAAALIFARTPWATGGRNLSEYRILNNCYSLLTGRYLPADSPYIALIRQKKKPAVEICQGLLDGVYLNEQGLVRAAGADDGLAQAVLRRFQLVHLSWFSRVGLTVKDEEYPTSSVVDMQAGANYWSYLLFAKDMKAKEIFSLGFVPQALRVSPVKPQWILEYNTRATTLERRTARAWTDQPFNLDDPAAPAAPARRWEPDFVPTGKLVGLMLPRHRTPAAQAREFKIPVTSFGAGVLGSQTYLMTNSNFIRGAVANGGNVMHRRYSEAVIRDFLCRDLPLLQEADVLARVRPDSAVTFQTSATCMKCHYTMDPLAAGFRNLVNSLTGMTTGHPFTSRIYRQLAQRSSEKMPLMLAKPDPAYGRAAPEGQLNYRNVDGDLVQFNFSTLDQLGRFIGDSKDFHYCVAKRYVKYFTGYDFDVRAKASEGRASKIFLALADRFYAAGTQKSLIRDILASDLFLREATP